MWMRRRGATVRQIFRWEAQRHKITRTFDKLHDSVYNIKNETVSSYILTNKDGLNAQPMQQMQEKFNPCFLSSLINSVMTSFTLRRDLLNPAEIPISVKTRLPGLQPCTCETYIRSEGNFWKTFVFSRDFLCF